MPRSGIVRAVDDLLERALGSRVNTLPVDLDALVFDHLCEHEGLVFVEDQVLGMDGQHEILGRTELLAGRIVVCASLKATDLRRFRFTVAHELGHWILHRPLFLDDREHPELFPSNTVFISTASSHSVVARGADQAEWQANCFASHLLIPRAALRREYSARFGTSPNVKPISSTLREHSRNVARSRAGGVRSIADAFEASIEATAIALEEIGLVVAEPVLL